MPISTTDVPESEERVLSTLNKDGSRRWLRPRVSTGRFLTGRRVVAYALILVFTVLPYLSINGKPLILLDIANREFTLLGTTFLPTDTLLLALLFLTIFITVFLITALFGRVWCGWACPQTVYMEFLYRPIERLFDGKHYRTGGRSGVPGWRRIAKFAVFLVISIFLAHTFLAYFVGVDTLFQWIQQSPTKHPTAFFVMAATTGLMMLDFCFFREQVCTLMCPYGRFQSVMLDRQSLIISYDETRGEPRGRIKRSKRKRTENGAETAVENGEKGDCIDCQLCVITCPTGIDIRQGLQMECIGCAQCIDACDEVMDRVDRPRGLIRYSSQEAMKTGRQRFFRPRVVIYPLLLAIILSLFGVTLARRQPADISFLRQRTKPYSVLESGDISTQIHVKVTDPGEGPRSYTITVEEASQLTSPDLPMAVEPGEAGTAILRVTVPRARFERGRAEITVRVTDEDGFDQTYDYHVLGPLFGSSNSAPAPPSSGQEGP